MNYKILLFSALLFPLVADSQSISLGASILGSNYSGDITADNMAILKQTSPGCGVHLSYEMDHLFTFRANYEFLKVFADDKLGIQDWQLKRNLNFSSRIHSIDISGYLNLKNLLTERYKRLNINLLAGYTLFNYNPIANYQGTQIELRSLGTEGQGMKGYASKYSNWANAINFGTNIEFLITEKFSIETQLLFRKTNTDYLDDISSNYVNYETLYQQNGVMAAELGNKIHAATGSQRGNPLDQDWFQSLSLGVKYRIYSKQKLHLTRLKKGSVHCPKFKF
ncbi:MAG: hypothetical protein HOP11_07160 [Saprospiraceae bacterium]|nr:hypothetical protein [Saprospiraceae bacterium]